jgi:hypothetical protein
MKNIIVRSLTNALCVAGLVSGLSATHANTLQLSQEGAGEVLIFPYYTVRNGTLPFVSLVNQTNAAKALRLRVRESVGGRPVAELNVFLSAKDVWTAAIVPSGEGAAIISNDKSCTHPKISGSSTGLVFSNAAYINDVASYVAKPLDRVREGYLEVIEMATVPNASVLGKDVTHSAGIAQCQLISTADITASSALAAPSGGVVGSMSFINLADGLSVSYNATGINGFWKTGPGAPLPAISPVTAPTPDLTSGANTSITVTDDGKTYVSTFARSIDAVSALFMVSSIAGEYAYTTDQVFSSTFVMTFPTKAYYIYPATNTTPTAPHQRAFDQYSATACDDGSWFSVDREEFVGVTVDDFPTAPPRPYSGPKWCGVTYVAGFLRPVANSLVITPTVPPGPFNSPNMDSLAPVQNQGLTPVPIGKEGGHLQATATNPNGFLQPTSSSVLTRSATTGEMTWTPVTHQYVGLPMLGFALSVAKYNSGSPQQNFANLNPLTTQRRINAP